MYVDAEFLFVSQLYVEFPSYGSSDNLVPIFWISELKCVCRRCHLHTYRNIFYNIFLIVVREPEGNSFARHINLQLTYSFQNNAQNSMQLNGNKSGLYPAHGKYYELVNIL